MTKTRELPLEIRTMIVALHNLGRSNRDTARKLKLSRRTVDYNVNKYQEAGTLLNINRRGQWKVTTPAEDRRIIMTSKRNRRKTSPEINIELEK